MSRCFDNGFEDIFDSEPEGREVSEDQWFSNFETPQQYLKVKLEMLEYDMCIKPTIEELDHLRELKTRGDIDRAVHSIIDRHWDKY